MAGTSRWDEQRRDNRSGPRDDKGVHLPARATLQVWQKEVEWESHRYIRPISQHNRSKNERHQPGEHDCSQLARCDDEAGTTVQSKGLQHISGTARLLAALLYTS